MKKEPRYTPRPDAKHNPHLIRFTKPKMHRYFTTKKAALAWRDDVEKFLRAFAAKDIDVMTIDETDYLFIIDKYKKLSKPEFKELRDAIRPIGLQDGEAGPEHATLRDAMGQYVKDRNSGYIKHPKTKHKMNPIKRGKRSGKLPTIYEYWLDRLGRKEMHTITVRQVKDALLALDDGDRETRTLNKYKTALAGVWSHWLKENPGSGVEHIPAQVEGESEDAAISYAKYTFEERDALINDCYAHSRFARKGDFLYLGEMVEFTSLIGIRAQYVCSLHENDIDWRTGELIREMKKVNIKVPLGKRAMEILRTQRQVKNKAGYLFPLGDFFPHTKVDGEMVGRPPKPFFDIADRLVEEGKLAPSKAAFHSLRGTAATLMHQQGVPLKTIKEILGVSIATLEAHYLDVTDAMKEAARKAQDSVSFKPSTRLRAV